MILENPSKQERYANLVSKRKKHSFPEGLQNPANILGGKFDGDEIGAWSRWHGDLNAKILLIGQDWGDEKYFEDNNGRDCDTNPTCKNLKMLFHEIGFYLGTTKPEAPKKIELFFTNAVLGIKNSKAGKIKGGNMSGPLAKGWITDSTLRFTKELIEVISPSFIFTLGLKAFNALRLIDSELGPERLMKELVERDNLFVNNGRVQVFARYHCGGKGLSNRSLENQKVDWQRMLPFLKIDRRAT